MSAIFGALLKDWRGQRRMSQLSLGMAANVSARHISFLETGRARPSQAMVLQLSDSLEIPRGDRNQLLQAAGFSRAYEARSLDDKELEYVSTISQFGSVEDIALADVKIELMFPADATTREALLANFS